MIPFTVILFCVLAFLFVIAGCAPTETPKEEPYIGGTEGITLEYDLYLNKIKENQYEVYSGDTFDINIIVRNKGEADVGVGDVKAELAGIIPTDFGVVSEVSNTQLLEKKTKVGDQIVPGGEEILSFGTATAPLIEGQVSPKQLYVTYTYPYETSITVQNVCFKGDITAKELCDYGDKNVYSSSAPIQAITASDALVGQNRVQVLISISNKGSGDAALTRDTFNNYRDEVEVVNLNPTEWECSPLTVRLQKTGEERKSIIRCITVNPLDEDSLAEVDLPLKLRYYYKDWVLTSLLLKKVE